MTDQELEAIEARAEAATPGPWETGADEDAHIVYDADSELVAGAESARYAADADFIANARTDIPALIAEVRRLREMVEGASNAV